MTETGCVNFFNYSKSSCVLNYGYNHQMLNTFRILHSLQSTTQGGSPQSADVPYANRVHNDSRKAWREFPTRTSAVDRSVSMRVRN